MELVHFFLVSWHHLVLDIFLIYSHLIFIRSVSWAEATIIVSASWPILRIGILIVFQFAITTSVSGFIGPWTKVTFIKTTTSSTILSTITRCSIIGCCFATLTRIFTISILILTLITWSTTISETVATWSKTTLWLPKKK